ncbi:MAG: hypothetical protein J6V00_09845 [Bacteroidaceae bacterium]|jgi:hypothetical protein|nr:hypothetical protein [Bacteroidaceae bacterium]
MKKIILFAVCVLAMATFSSCRSSKEKSPIKTFVMPCSEYTKGDGALRAWASGASDNETTARKKALATASAELAAMLSKTIKQTTEDYSSALTEGENVLSKSFMNDKVKITVEKSIEGATIICDRWNKDENGQYTNYIVLELKGNDYLKALYEELSKNSDVSVDKELLQKLFLENINKNSAE